MKDIYGRGGDPNEVESDEKRKERILENRKEDAKPWLEQVEELPDDQEINVYDKDDGFTQKHKISAGEFRKRLTDAVENEDEGVKVRFDDGGIIAFDYPGYYSIEVVTPEIKAQEEEEIKNLKIIDGLKQEGVDTDIFFKFYENGEKEIRYTPEQVLEIGKKIEAYLQKK